VRTWESPASFPSSTLSTSLNLGWTRSRLCDQGVGSCARWKGCLTALKVSSTHMVPNEKRAMRRGARAVSYKAMSTSAYDPPIGRGDRARGKGFEQPPHPRHLQASERGAELGGVPHQVPQRAGGVGPSLVVRTRAHHVQQQWYGRLEVGVSAARWINRKRTGRWRYSQDIGVEGGVAECEACKLLSGRVFILDPIDQSTDERI
jgi:hypothetical protein